ncbi:hypothetical protein [Hydrogenophaga sp.]|uniref:hypothetical protein n=1 Tax=Hydrogenophaga sp. TaxID=1904254 RepID=UPI002728F057|nr:hypothetical protein [Hydrogenophaga sp.]MDO9434843.1 hypothetical protein [Hydrogenophaga sp.]
MSLHDLMVSLCLMAAPMAAWAHGDWPPKHGGLMNEGGETSFELVQRPDGIHFYVEDHGEMVSTSGSQATLTVANPKQTRTFKGSAAAKNKLVFPRASVRPGDKVMLKVQFAAGSVAVGRYKMPAASAR